MAGRVDSRHVREGHRAKHSVRPLPWGQLTAACNQPKLCVNALHRQEGIVESFHLVFEGAFKQDTESIAPPLDRVSLRVKYVVEPIAEIERIASVELLQLPLDPGSHRDGA